MDQHFNMIKLMEIFGKKVKLYFSTKNKSIVYDGLLSANTFPDDLPYRLTWFNKYMKPIGHITMNKDEAIKIISNIPSEKLKKELGIINII